MYKTADQLNITKGERKWLIKTAKVLATMSPKAVRQIDGLNMGFDLAQWFQPRTENETVKAGKTLCGTVGCVKGWMGTLAMASGELIDLGVKVRKGTMPSRYVAPTSHLNTPPMLDWCNSYVLTALFTPDWMDAYSGVTPKDAAKTIIRFLKTGRVEYPLKYFGHYKDREIERRKSVREGVKACSLDR